MEIREFSERVLFGRGLADKLLEPGTLTDEHPGDPIGRVPEPGRPPGLALERRPGHVGTFPSIHALEDEATRGTALHFFANHELLALELMALALLRFPDAPLGFRRTLVSTLVDEQRHFRLYVERMKGLGVEFGEHGLGAAFWTGLSEMQTPVEYLAKLGLVFEQANLDFACFYRDLFTDLGDRGSAAVMSEVYEDEVRHVRVGLKWFEQLAGLERPGPGADPRERGERLFARHCEVLGMSLPLSRARGKVFDAAGRRRAGFPESYIERLRAHRASKGRAPHVWAWNDFDDDEGPLGIGVDHQLLAAFLAAEDDVVFVAQGPGAAWIDRMQRFGCTVPRLVEPSGKPDSLARIGHRRLADVQPRRWTESFAAQVTSVLRNAEVSAEPTAALAGARRAETEARGAVEEARRWLASDEAPFARWSADGDAWLAAADRDSDAASARCELLAGAQVDARGECVAVHITRVHRDRRDRVDQVWLGPLGPSIPEPLRRFAHDDGRHPRRVERAMESMLGWWARRLHAIAYAGPVTLRAAISETDDGELGCRLSASVAASRSLAHVARRWQDRLARGARGRWIRLLRSPQESVTSLRSTVGRLERLAQVTLDSNGRVRGGVLATTDLAAARDEIGVLVVAPTEDGLDRLLAQLSDR